ncbi:hypothetical protein SAY86_017419 [Trapa natans]|uniref:Uncharacterized protein n=1 Tax=Trapa natans TaxID=22666 RepID=A0AAN7R6F4_TRANT|nr:hypothetical protein SAY86_017419 [Trapa natans]
MIESIQRLVFGKPIVLSCGKDFIYLHLLQHCPQHQTQLQIKQIILHLVLFLCHLKLTVLVFLLLYHALIFLKISYIHPMGYTWLHGFMILHTGELSETQIGQITFDMFTSMNVSELKPLSVELAQFIAHQLDVNITQVHLLGVTAKVNGSLIKWAVLPVSPGKSISNSSAMEIISRLSDNLVQLPETFGSYRFTEWHVEPPETRTWWQKHYQLVIVATAVTLLVGLSASGVWLLWRQRQKTFNAYKPVDTIFPEQELQPL